MSDPNTTLDELGATLRKLLALLEGSDDPDTDTIGRLYRDCEQSVACLQGAAAVIAADAKLCERIEGMRHLYGAALTLAGRHRDALATRLASIGPARKSLEGQRPLADSGSFCDMQG